MRPCLAGPRARASAQHSSHTRLSLVPPTQQLLPTTGPLHLWVLQVSTCLLLFTCPQVAPPPAGLAQPQFNAAAPFALAPSVLTLWSPSTMISFVCSLSPSSTRTGLLKAEILVCYVISIQGQCLTLSRCSRNTC